MLRYIKLILSLILLAAGSGDAWAQRTVVQGTVHDAGGEALPFANVVITGSPVGAATDQAGYYSFSTTMEGSQTLTALMLGYETGEVMITLPAPDTLTIDFILQEVLIEMDEAIVTASAYATGDAEAVTLESLEVLTTPGAAADILLAIKTFPGVAMVDEGAGLFVRGGDVDETVLLLDQATVIHPYKYESPTGGVFGTIPPFLVGGTYFSSGGFSAKYGNALSGVLSMESQDMPEISNYSFNVGLAAASTSGAIVLAPGKLGVRFSGNRSLTEWMMDVNGIADEFTLTPRGWDGNVSVLYAYSSTGRFKFFNFGTSDRLGVRVNEPSFDGIYRGSSESRLHNLQWSDLFGNWLVQASASLNRYDARQTLGLLELEPIDTSYKLRVDVERDATGSTRWYAGVETESLRNRFRGTFPGVTDVLDPEAAALTLDQTNRGQRTGAYAEVEWKATRQLALRAGLRGDHVDLANTMTVDPRFSLLFAVNKHMDLRAAWGMYHQYPLPSTFGQSNGLEPERAQHFIAGAHYEKGAWLARAEVYAKPYRNLVVNTGPATYQNVGRGHARGADFFVKYGGFLQTRVNGWMAYSWLQSSRSQARAMGYDQVVDYGPSSFDITHNFTLVAKARLVGFFSAGFTFRHATGRPITPVTGSIPANEGGFFLPIEGAVSSERLPDFRRLDTSLSYYLPFGNGHNATFYLAISNLLNRDNVLAYDYSLDYSQRTSRTTNYSRFVYFGVSVNFSRFPRS